MLDTVTLKSFPSIEKVPKMAEYPIRDSKMLAQHAWQAKNHTATFDDQKKVRQMV